MKKLLLLLFLWKNSLVIWWDRLGKKDRVGVGGRARSQSKHVVVETGLFAKREDRKPRGTRPGKITFFQDSPHLPQGSECATGLRIKQDNYTAGILHLQATLLLHMFREYVSNYTSSRQINTFPTPTYILCFYISCTYCRKTLSVRFFLIDLCLI